MGVEEKGRALRTRSRLPAWLLWLFLGALGGDRFYVKRFLEGAAQVLLTALTLALFLGRPTQVLLGQLGAAVVGYSANLIDLSRLWQTDLMICCLFALAAWKLTNAANLNRRVANLNLPSGQQARPRAPLSTAGAAARTAVALGLGIIADSLASGMASYVAASMRDAAMITNAFNALHVAVGLTTLSAALRAASRARTAGGRWLLGLPPVLMLGLFGVGYYLLYGYFGLPAFSFLGQGPLASGWLRAALWHSDMRLMTLIRAAGSDEARLGLALASALIQAGAGVVVAGALTAAAAAAASAMKRREA
jgi:hypothetical protein